LHTPGDRRSDCCARMKPMALSFKNYEVNLFTGRGSGELMIVHQCINCDKISPNRIAGDDNEYQIISLLEESLCLDENTRNKMTYLGIDVITHERKEAVLISLFGINYKEQFNRIEKKF